MGYLIPAQFVVEPNKGGQVFALGRRINQDDEAQALITRGHHLWAYLCRRRVLSYRPASPFTTTGGDIAVEGLGQISTKRYNTSFYDLTAYVDFGGGTVAVTIYDQTFTTAYASLTHTSGTRTQVALNFTGITSQTVGVRVSITATTPTATVYGAELVENPVIGSDLAVSGEFVPVDETFYAGGRSLNALLTRRIIKNTTESGRSRTPLGAEALDPDRPLVLASLTEMVAERVIPLHPELRSLTVKMRYKCNEAAVKVRWSVAWDGGHSEPSAWETISTTGGSWALYVGSVSLAPALEAGKSLARLRMHFASESNTGGKVYGPLAVAANLEARSVNLALPLASYYTGADEVSAARLEFETGAGVAVSSSGDGVRQLLRWENGDGNALHFYPPIPDAEVALLAPQVGRVAITPLGRILVGAWYVKFSHGTPYAGAGARFPWEDSASAHYALTTGRSPGAPQFASLYSAQEHLWQSRVPLYGWGAQPHTHPSGYAALRGMGFVQLTWSAFNGSPDAWYTLASWVVGEGDEFELDGATKTRQALEVVAQLLCTGWFIEGFRVQARLVWETEGGVSWVTGAAQLIDLSNAPPNTFPREVFTEPATASYPGAHYLKTLGCGMPAQDWGRASYFKATLRDLTAGHTAGRVLRLEVRPDRGLQEGDFGHSSGVFVYYNSGFARPLPNQSWPQVGV